MYDLKITRIDTRKPVVPSLDLKSDFASYVAGCLCLFVGTITQGVQYAEFVKHSALLEGIERAEWPIIASAQFFFVMDSHPVIQQAKSKCAAHPFKQLMDAIKSTKNVSTDAQSRNSLEVVQSVNRMILAHFQNTKVCGLNIALTEVAPGVVAHASRTASLFKTQDHRKHADKAFKTENYEEAYKHYLSALEQTSDTNDIEKSVIYYRLAICSTYKNALLDAVDYAQKSYLIRLEMLGENDASTKQALQLFTNCFLSAQYDNSHARTGARF